jgi:hypothetical protein
VDSWALLSQGCASLVLGYFHFLPTGEALSQRSIPSVAEAHNSDMSFSARLKPCPDTKHMAVMRGCAAVTAGTVSFIIRKDFYEHKHR